MFSAFLLDGNLCIYKRLLGIPCPGCGMTRAYYGLFHGDIHAAFFYHPLFFLPPILVLTYVFRNFRGIRKIYWSNIYWVIILVLVLVVYVIRLLMYFPDTAPMDLNPQGVLPSILRALSAYT